MKPIYLLLLILMNFFWAGSYSAFKALAPHLNPGGVVTMRFGLAAVVLLAAWPWLRGQTPRGGDFIKTVIMGIAVFVIGPRLQVAAVQLGQAGDAAVLMGLEPLIASVAAAIFLREHIGPRRWIGFCLGLSGVLFLARVWRPDFQFASLTASSLMVASFVTETAYSIMGKPLIIRAGLLKVLALALGAGTVVNLCIDGARTLTAARAMPLNAWLLILYLAIICTLAGYALWFVVIRETEVNVTALTVFIQPVVGVMIASAWLGETLHWGQLWGSVAIVVGLAIALSRQIKAPSSNIQAPEKLQAPNTKGQDSNQS